MTRRSLPATPTPTPPDRSTNPRLRRAAYRGEIPGEELPRRDREDLIYDLWALGWSDAQIAAHTLWTEHTVERIRGRLGLNANTEGAT